MFAQFKPHRENIVLPFFRRMWFVGASRSHLRGVRVVTNVGRGMRWTLWPRETSAVRADGQVVWSRSPEAEIKPAEWRRRTSSDTPSG